MSKSAKSASVRSRALRRLSPSPKPYKNPSAPTEQRVDDLVSRMTLEEKISQLMNDSPAIDRLGDPRLQLVERVPPRRRPRRPRHRLPRNHRPRRHLGHRRCIFRVATAISDEARAKHHEFVRRGKRNIYQGLTFWTPNINLFRDPRWGRGMETYGEDPYLTGRMAVAVHQRPARRRSQVSEDRRHRQTLRRPQRPRIRAPHLRRRRRRHRPPRHLPAAVRSRHQGRRRLFRHVRLQQRRRHCPPAPIPGCSTRSCASNGASRATWSPTAARSATSTCSHKSVADRIRGRRRSPSKPAPTSTAASNTQTCCPPSSQGLISEAEIDRAVRRLLLARFRLGMFDPPEMVKYAQIPYSVNDSPAHRELALETARKSIVLLKNDATRCLSASRSRPSPSSAPTPTMLDVLLGNYNGIPTAPVTPLAGIRAKLGATPKCIYARGSDLAANMPNFEASSRHRPLRPQGRVLQQRQFRLASISSARTDLSQFRPERRHGSRNPKPLFTRVDAKIDFEWWDGAPRADMNDDDFGVRWTGTSPRPSPAPINSAPSA